MNEDLWEAMDKMQAQLQCIEDLLIELKEELKKEGAND